MSTAQRSNRSEPTASGKRRVKPAVRAIRAWLSATSRIAPNVAERHAARLFLTPRRKRGAPPPAVGASARPFSLRLDAHHLHGWSWGDGPLALLVHGWEGSAVHMVPAAVSLAELGFRAVALDMPAHGQSSGTRTSLVEWVKVLREIPRVLGAPQVVLGHSFGGTALTFAIAEGLPAQRAVLLAAPLGPMHFIERASRYMGLPAERIGGMVRRLGEMVGRDISEFDASRAAATISVPGLVVHDPEDPDVPWAHAAAIADAWPDSRLLARHGVGHYRILGDPRTLEPVTRFAAGALPVREGARAS